MDKFTAAKPREVRIWLDVTTGLQNNLHRWLDPQVGRWISEDPIGFAAGDANVYRYVGNRVISIVDPSGLSGGPNVDDLVISIAQDFVFLPGVGPAPIDSDASIADADAWGPPLPPPPYEIYVHYDDGPLETVPLFEQPVFWLASLWTGLFRPPGASPTIDPWRRVPTSLQEKLTMDEARGGAGRWIKSDLGDPRFKGYEKWHHSHKHPDGTQTIIHYVRDPKTGKCTDFKFNPR